MSDRWGERMFSGFQRHTVQVLPRALANDLCSTRPAPFHRAYASNALVGTAALYHDTVESIREAIEPFDGRATLETNGDGTWYLRTPDMALSVRDPAPGTFRILDACNSR